MPKWWATSWITVTRTWSTTPDSVTAWRQMGTAVDRDPVGHGERARRVAVGVVPIRERHALVQAEQVAVAAVLLHEHGHVLHELAEALGDPVERLDHQFLEPLGVRPRPWPASYPAQPLAPPPTIDAAGGEDAAGPAAATPAQVPHFGRGPGPAARGTRPRPARGGAHRRRPAGDPGAGRVGQDPGADPPHRPARGRRLGRRPPRAGPHVHPAGRRRAAASPRAARSAGPAHCGHVPRRGLVGPGPAMGRPGS